MTVGKSLIRETRFCMTLVYALGTRKPPLFNIQQILKSLETQPTFPPVGKSLRIWQTVAIFDKKGKH